MYIYYTTIFISILRSDCKCPILHLFQMENVVVMANDGDYL